MSSYGSLIESSESPKSLYFLCRVLDVSVDWPLPICGLLVLRAANAIDVRLSPQSKDAAFPLLSTLLVLDSLR